MDRHVCWTYVKGGLLRVCDVGPHLLRWHKWPCTHGEGGWQSEDDGSANAAGVALGPSEAWRDSISDPPPSTCVQRKPLTVTNAKEE